MAGDVIMSFVADICGEPSEEKILQNMHMHLEMWVVFTLRYIARELKLLANLKMKL